jgi:N-acetyl-1-D-myo-inositol-2-amino-2-deoxy-alpha-D-glucopyranoside deacetylase
VTSVLFVHAHPDDETITTGATMARYAAEGAEVHLVTCTRGEEGEVIPPALRYLEDDRDGALGPFRVGELEAALAELGVRNHWYLDELAPDGAPLDLGRARYRDSGMAGTPPSRHPHAFASADLEVAAGRLARLIQRLRPRVLVTYDPYGGYGHPDHIQAHLVATRGLQLSAWAVPKVYWIAVPATVASAAPGLTSAVVDDALVTTAVDGSAYVARKVAALRAHATQIELAPDESGFALSNGIRQPVAATEYFQLVQGVTGGRRDGDGRERDLLA